MKKLPDDVRELFPAEKLAWWYISENPGEHSARSLVEALGGGPVTWARTIKNLVAAGLVIEERAPGGKTPGAYRVSRERGRRRAGRSEEGQAT